MSNKTSVLGTKVSNLNSALGSFAYWDSVSTGESGAKSLSMSRTMRAEHMYLIFVRRLNGSNEIHPPYGYLLFMRSTGWNFAVIGSESEVTKKDISNGKLNLTFRDTQWTRMTVYEVM